MSNITKIVPKRDVSYYRQRFKNRVFAKLSSFVADQSAEQKLSKKDIAARLGKDPALITRWLTQPSNLTLDTISDILLALEAEPDPPEMVLFKDRRPANYIHPLVAQILNVPERKVKPKIVSTSELEATWPSTEDKKPFHVYTITTSG
jgi:transcriptional regulator with XRE-family HTH domain